MSNFSNIADVTTSVAPLSPPTTLTVAVCNDLVGNDLDTVLTITNPSNALGQVQMVGSEPSTQSESGTVAGDDQSTSHLEAVSVPVEPIPTRLAQAKAVIQQATQQAKDGNFSAAFERPVLAELAHLKKHYVAEFQRARLGLRQANSLIKFPDLDRAIRDLSMMDVVAKQTHHGYAKEILIQLTVDGHSPVSHQGLLYVVERHSSLWKKCTMDELVKLVAESHDGKDNCKRNGDYIGVSKHAVSLVDSSDFFESADVGLACKDGFYRVVDDTFRLEPLTPSHRQRVQVSFTPRKMATPLFDKFLHETFASKNPDEEAQQVMLVQEFAGAILLGQMPRYHRAGFFYDAFGRAGKSTLEKILRALVPTEFITGVSPFLWNDEYYIASLEGSRLNVVAELPEGRSIPAAEFKSVIGGDLIMGRHPMGRPFSFTNEAAHLFTSNHFIDTKDQSDAFYIRWLMFDFPNSRTKSGLPIDTELDTRIIGSELAGIGWWALDGAARLLRNTKFSSSNAHNRLMKKWRLGNSSLNEFIDECCDLVPQDQVIRKTTLYAAYASWCRANGRKAYSSRKVTELLDCSAPVGTSLASLDGYDIVRGLRFKPTEVEIAVQTKSDDRF